MSNGFSIIVATEQRGGIGKNNHLVWKDKNDLAFFRKVTTNTTHLGKTNALIMGMKTWLSLPNRPLQNRLNIVISSKKNTDIDYIKGLVIADSLDSNSENPLFFSSLEEAFGFCEKISWIENVFVIGGGKIYDYCLNNYIDQLDRVYWTKMEGEYDCDVFFVPPSIFFDKFKEVFEETYKGSKRVIYENIYRMKY